MIRALYTAATGMNAQQMNLDNIANNLSNSSTNGFQERRMQFTDLLYQSQVMPGSASTQQTTVAAGLQIGSGVKPSAAEIIQTQGAIESTGIRWTWPSRAPASFRCSFPAGRSATPVQVLFILTLRAMSLPPMAIRFNRASPYRRMQRMFLSAVMER